jgi:hypothetical protein
LRGRREDDEAGVELVRTSLACIAGESGYYARWERACGRAEREREKEKSVIAQAGDGRAALIGLVVVVVRWACLSDGIYARGDVYVRTEQAMAFGRSGRGWMDGRDQRIVLRAV